MTWDLLSYRDHDVAMTGWYSPVTQDCKVLLQAFTGLSYCRSQQTSPDHSPSFHRIHRVVWVERHLKDQVPAPLLWAGTPSITPDGSELHPAWP